MFIDKTKCIDWLKKHKLYYCCESPIWVFSEGQDGTIHATCEYCGHEVTIPAQDLS